MQLPFTPAFRSRRPRCERSVDDSLGELGRGLLRRLVAYELDRQHRAEAADVADLSPACLPGEHPRAERVAEDLGTRDELLLGEDVEDGTRRREGDGVPDEGPADRTRMRVVHDLGPSDHARERQTAGDRLRDDHEVGLDVEVLHREHPGGPPEARLHLVRNQDDAVLVADPAQPLDELGGRRDEPALPLLRLEHDRGDVLRRHVRDEEPLERGERGSGVGPSVCIRIRRAVHLGRERPEVLLVGICLGGHRERHPASGRGTRPRRR